MSEWIKVGDRILNVSNIEFVERNGPMKITVFMSSGRSVELTNTMANNLWKYLDGERLKFLDLDNPTRDFSGT
jgi:hypothetical protein